MKALDPRTGSTTAAPSHRRGMVGAIAALIGATLFWAGNYIIGEAAVTAIDPLSLVLLRWVIALVPLVVIAQVVEKPDWKAALRAWPWLLALCVFGLLGYNLLLYSALEHTSAFNASLINAFNPALITLAAAAVLREKLTPLSILGVIAALIGVLVVLTDGDLGLMFGGGSPGGPQGGDGAGFGAGVGAGFGAGFGPGELLMIGAIITWTAYTIIGRRAPKLPPITSTAIQAAMAIVVLSPVSLATGGPALPATQSILWALIYIGIFPSVMSYLLWNKALTVLPASGAGVFLNLITVFTAAFTMLSGQPYSAAQVIGGITVIVGVAVANARGLLPRRT